MKDSTLKKLMLSLHEDPKRFLFEVEFLEDDHKDPELFQALIGCEGDLGKLFDSLWASPRKNGKEMVLRCMDLQIEEIKKKYK